MQNPAAAGGSCRCQIGKKRPAAADRQTDAGRKQAERTPGAATGGRISRRIINCLVCDRRYANEQQLAIAACPGYRHTHTDSLLTKGGGLQAALRSSTS
jgi:hypothetical protein